MEQIKKSPEKEQEGLMTRLTYLESRQKETEDIIIALQKTLLNHIDATSSVTGTISKSELPNPLELHKVVQLLTEIKKCCP